MSEWSEEGQAGARGIDMSLGCERESAERMDTSEQRPPPAQERQVSRAGVRSPTVWGCENGALFGNLWGV